MNKIISIVFPISIGIIASIVGLFIYFREPFFIHPVIDNLMGIKKPEIIGFLPYWLISRAEKNYLPYLSTLTYFGFTIDPDGTVIKLTNPQEEDPGWYGVKTDAVKKQLTMFHHREKTSLLVHSADEYTIHLLMENPKQHASNLMTDVTPVMKEYGFSDLNIDIESFLETSPSSQLQFTTFIKTIKEEMDNKSLGTLTLDISPTAFRKTFLIDPKAVEPYVDFLVLMTYDYSYSGSYVSGPVAPLDGAPAIREQDVETSIQEALSVYSRSKLIMGIPLYGYEWETLQKNPIQAVIPGGGVAASAERVNEFLATCTHCEKGYDDIAKQPYILYPDETGTFFHQIFYENDESFQEKLHLAQKYNLRGVALWALGYETDTMLEPLKKYKQTPFQLR